VLIFDISTHSDADFMLMTTILNAHNFWVYHVDEFLNAYGDTSKIKSGTTLTSGRGKFRRALPKAELEAWVELEKMKAANADTPQ
jgi:hypothetical protein